MAVVVEESAGAALVDDDGVGGRDEVDGRDEVTLADDDVVAAVVGTAVVAVVDEFAVGSVRRSSPPHPDTTTMTTAPIAASRCFTTRFHATADEGTASNVTGVRWVSTIEWPDGAIAWRALSSI